MSAAKTAVAGRDPTKSAFTVLEIRSCVNSTVNKLIRINI